MRILFYKKTNLAKNPDIWAHYLSKYKKVETKVVNSLANHEFDFVHFNNTYEKFNDYLKKSLMHYHGHPEHENKKGKLDSSYEGHIIINAAHIANGASKDYEPLRWIPIDLESEFYDVQNPKDKIRICYTPSVITNSSNFPYHSKGFELTYPILQNLKNKFPNDVEINVLHGVQYEKCLQIKALSNIVIDECVTGNYHMSGFEGLGMGKMVIGFFSEENKDLMLNTMCPNADRIPYESVHITKLENYLNDLVSNKKLDFVLKRGEENKEWMYKNWNLDDMLEEMLKRYERILSK